MSIAIVSETNDDSAEYLLRQMLSQVGIPIATCHRFSVIQRPMDDIIRACGPKATSIPGLEPYATNRYLQREFAPDLAELTAQLQKAKPNVILALDRGSALALTGSAKIKNIRGAVAPTRSGHKAVFTYGPRAVQRDWTIRPVVLADYDKVRREAAHPEIRRPSRQIWIEPTLSDLIAFEERYFQNDPLLSIDIETAGTQITCIGFAPNSSVAIVVPFFLTSSPARSYWADRSTEIAAWRIVKRWCENYRALFQNGLYDTQFLWRSYGIRCFRAEHDTMLLHHALQPEMKKGLGFLATLYSEEQSWKFMRTSGETAKREDT